MSRAKPSIAELLERERQRCREAAARHRMRVLNQAEATAPLRARRRQVALAYTGPAMVAGDGERREDCARYRACIDRWVLITGGTRAHCPALCSGYVRAVEVPAARSASPLAFVHSAPVE